MSTQAQMSRPAMATDPQAPTANDRRETFLRRTLLANSVFSILSGLLLVLGAGPIAAFMGVAPTLPFIVIGAAVLVFGADVLWVATRPALSRPTARAIFWLDVVWVVGSALILATDAFGLSGGGRWAIAGVADVVLVFAILEFFGLRRLQ